MVEPPSHPHFCILRARRGAQHHNHITTQCTVTADILISLHSLDTGIFKQAEQSEQLLSYIIDLVYVILVIYACDLQWHSAVCANRKWKWNCNVCRWERQRGTATALRHATHTTSQDALLLPKQNQGRKKHARKRTLPKAGAKHTALIKHHSVSFHPSLQHVSGQPPMWHMMMRGFSAFLFSLPFFSWRFLFPYSSTLWPMWPHSFSSLSSDWTTWLVLTKMSSAMV